MNNINFLNRSAGGYFHHVDKASEATHFTHSLFVSGDYCGGSVERANRESLLKNKELIERLGIEELCESYSTESLLFPIAALKDTELKEIFKALEDYPLLDECLWSEVELDMEHQDFEDFGLYDFKKYLIKNDLLDEDTIENYTNEELTQVYYSAARETNYNIWTVENGTSGFFDFDSFGGLHDKSIPLLKKILVEVKNGK